MTAYESWFLSVCTLLVHIQLTECLIRVTRVKPSVWEKTQSGGLYFVFAIYNTQCVLPQHSVCSHEISGSILCSPKAPVLLSFLSFTWPLNNSYWCRLSCEKSIWSHAVGSPPLKYLTPNSGDVFLIRRFKKSYCLLGVSISTFILPSIMYLVLRTSFGPRLENTMYFTSFLGVELTKFYFISVS